jgi:glycosyltransferase involved in cell wall biosynthesis
VKVCLVSTSDIEGGAARAAYRLHRGLRGIDVDSQMLVLKKASDDEFVQKLPSALGEWMPRLNYRLDGLPLRRYPNRQPRLVWSLNWVPYPIGKILEHSDAALLHLHWIGAGFIPLRELRRVRKPIVWTLHDEWAFTGGCHYTYDCQGFTQMCGNCPQLGSKQETDLSRRIWKQKHRYWNNLNLTVIAPSQWLARQARQSVLFANRRIEVIPNPIDTQVYKPLNRQLARQLLNLPTDKKLILFVAMSSTSDYRKGFHLLQPAIAQLASSYAEQAELIVIGASEKSSNPNSGLKTHYLGSFYDDLSIAIAYAAADVFVAPSLQENLPNTIMEALACATPCVAFDVGGIPDLIEHQRNGYLAKPYEIDDLAKGIAWVLEDEQRHSHLSARARKKVEDEFELNKIALWYRSLYEKTLAPIE